MSICYYVLEHVPSTTRWTFSSEKEALDFLHSRICWGCKQDVKNGLYVDHTNKGVESIVVQTPLDTDCGSEFSLQKIDKEIYNEQAKKAFDEMTQLWEKDYNSDVYDGLEEKNDI